MKTSELIAELQRLDPNGSADVVLGNSAIAGVALVSGSYDGAYQRLTHEHGQGSGIEITTAGHKVALAPFDLEPAILDDPNFPVTFASDLSADTRQFWEVVIEGWRNESREIHDDVERCMFHAWQNQRGRHDLDVELVSASDPMPEDLQAQSHRSYRDRRFEDWNRRWPTT